MPAREEFIVVEATIVGNMEDGYRTVYAADDIRYRTIEEAIKAGWESRDSDDFNIGVVRGQTLVRFGWMHELDRDHDEIAEVAAAIGLRAPRRPREGA